MLSLSVAREHSDVEHEREIRESLRWKAVKLEECRACPLKGAFLCIPRLFFSLAQAMGFSRKCQSPMPAAKAQPKAYPGYVLRGVKTKLPAA